MNGKCSICGSTTIPNEANSCGRCSGCGAVFATAMSAAAGGGRLWEVGDDSNTIALYFREIDRVCLLTAEEEVELARAIEAGEDAAARLASDRNLDDATRATLRQTVTAGQHARSRLIEANTRLVVSIARRYLNRGMPLGDLIQEGNLGLLEAVKRFDYRRGFRFATYATWWIRQAVARSVGAQATAMRFPVHVTQQQMRLARIRDQIEQELGRTPTPEEIALRAGRPPKQVRQCLEAWRAPASLEEIAFGYEEGEGEWADYVEDKDAPHPADVAVQEQLRDELAAAMSALTAREERVLELRFGLRDGRNHNLAEIAQRFGVTRERIRQIEARALHKLREPRRARRLQDFAMS